MSAWAAIWQRMEAGGLSQDRIETEQRDAASSTFTIIEAQTLLDIYTGTVKGLDRSGGCRIGSYWIVAANAGPQQDRRIWRRVIPLSGGAPMILMEDRRRR